MKRFGVVLNVLVKQDAFVVPGVKVARVLRQNLGQHCQRVVEFLNPSESQCVAHLELLVVGFHLENRFKLSGRSGEVLEVEGYGRQILARIQEVGVCLQRSLEPGDGALDVVFLQADKSLHVEN